MNILHELYHGNISPVERQTEKTEEYRECIKQINEIEKILKEQLSKEQWELYEECVGLIFAQAAISEEQMFTYAFGLGAKMMLEVSDK